MSQVRTCVDDYSDEIAVRHFSIQAMPGHKEALHSQVQGPCGKTIATRSIWLIWLIWLIVAKLDRLKIDGKQVKNLLIPQ